MLNNKGNRELSVNRAVAVECSREKKQYLKLLGQKHSLLLWLSSNN